MHSLIASKQFSMSNQRSLVQVEQKPNENCANSYPVYSIILLFPGQIAVDEYISGINSCEAPLCECPLVLLSKIRPRIVFELSKLIAVSIRNKSHKFNRVAIDLELCLLRNQINLRPWPITQSTGGCVPRWNLSSSPVGCPVIMITELWMYYYQQ